MAYRYRLKKKLWTVYGLFDVRGMGQPFYVGVTHDVALRVSRHVVARRLAVHRKLVRIEATGGRCVVRSLAQFTSREEAGHYERWLVATTPDLLNHRGVLVRTLTRIINADFTFAPHTQIESPVPKLPKERKKLA